PTNLREFPWVCELRSSRQAQSPQVSTLSPLSQILVKERISLMPTKPERISRLVKLFLPLIVIFTLMGSVFAQAGSTGAISGTVRDEKGAIVPGAQVEVVNATTGVTERTVTTDGNGNFGVTQLPPGTYKLAVTASGFSKAELPDVKVNVTETTTVSVPLKVGQINETVTVTEAASQV